MFILTLCVFLPLMLALMAVSFSDRLRSRVLTLGPVRALEKRLVISDRTYWLLFALIMAAGVFSRCYRFLELPLGYNQDGLMAAVESYCLSQGGVDQFGTSWPTYFEAWGFSQMSTLYSYLMIPFIRILGSCKLALRLPMLLVSLAMLPVVWDFARRMLGKGFALLALFIVAINPWHVLQSRWALEANLMPHVLLVACYLLLIGREHRWALYLSMVFFGLAPYAYGLASFSVPVLLLILSVYYAARRKANAPDILICMLVFFAVSGPYYCTMVINAFSLENIELGPLTMPLFEESHRTNDMPFTQLNPYAAALHNLIGFLYATVLGGREAGYNAIPWTHVMYRFMTPLFVYALYRMWRDRRRMVLAQEDEKARDGMMIVLVWLFASLVNGLLIGGVINRNNVVYYPMILVCAYGLYLMGKRLRTALAVTAAMLAVSFIGMNVTYFTDETYQRSYTVFQNGLVDALEDTWDWDYDEVYVSQEGGQKLVEASIMYAHDIDYAGRSEQTELLNASGEPTGWYFTERYRIVSFEDFEPDPMACSLYIVTQEEKAVFSEEDFLLTDYGDYAAVYPRYWAE